LIKSNLVYFGKRCRLPLLEKISREAENWTNHLSPRTPVVVVFVDVVVLAVGVFLSADPDINVL
jgi:hypothetical protein